MSKAIFVGRDYEMARLRGFLHKKSASLLLVRGRRRIGKSRLLAEWGKEMRSIFFYGIPPSPKTTAQREREEFADQAERAGLSGLKRDDWGNLLWGLSKHTQEGRILIVLDEIAWIGGKDPLFCSKLKTAWDMYFSKNPQLLMVLCSSHSSWVEENIFRSTGFVGRISLDLVLRELKLPACNAFLNSAESRISPKEKFQILALTGGVPFYLEHMKEALSAQQNIQELFFHQGLVGECELILSELFSRGGSTYKAVLSLLSEGPKESIEICKRMGVSRGGARSLEKLVQAGIVQRDFTWHLKSGEESRLSRYRLSDNYLRYSVQKIANGSSLVEKRRELLFAEGPRWDEFMRLQLVNLVLHNYQLLWEMLGIPFEEVVRDGPFFQRATKKQSGCQIDYMVQTCFNTLYIFELRFSKDPIPKVIIQEVEEKIRRLNRPSTYLIRPVLIHVNGVDKHVLEEGYFTKILDWSALLE